MANIIVSVPSCIGFPWQKKSHNDSFTQEFINALVRAGNKVLNIKYNDFATKKARKSTNYGKVRKRIRDFNPDLIITFNNGLINEDMLKYTNCPVACFSADSPAYFCSPELIKNYQDRYYFFHFSLDIHSCIKDWFPFIKDDRNFIFGIAIDFKRIEKEQDIEISFVGSMAIWNKDILGYFSRLFSFNNISKSMNWDCSYDIDKIKDEFVEKVEEFRKFPLSKLSSDLPDIDDSQLNLSLIYLLTSQMRQEICHSLADIGLKIFTIPANFEDFILYGFDIFKCLNTRPVYFLDDLEDVYNRSIISLNMPNIQAVNGFSWRVYNILASKSVLLTNKKQYLKDLLKGYADLPMYETPAEARDIAKRFLSDKAYRNELVLGCNKFVEEKCRFDDKLKFLAGIVKVELIMENISGSCEDVEYEDYSIYPKFLLEAKMNKKRLKELKKLSLNKYKIH